VIKYGIFKNRIMKTKHPFLNLLNLSFLFNTLLTLFLGLFLLIAGCDDEPEGNHSNDECDLCRSDDWCREGLTCEEFDSSGGGTVKLCATLSTQVCK
jgi:hypothetical protein